MVDIKEVRHGNYLKDRGDKILRIDFIENGKFGQEMYVNKSRVHPLTEEFIYANPIPLTEDILFKCGFEKHDNNSFQWDSNYGFTLWSKSGDTVHLYFESDEFGQSIKTLHHLQNVVFSLLQTELSIDLSS